MGSLGRAVVDVVANLKGLDRGIDAAEGRLSGFAAKSGKLLGGLAVGAGLAAGAAAIADATMKAADLGETLSKVDATFGKSGAAVKKTAQEMADKFGLVKRVSLDGATNIGLVGLAAGMTSAASAELGADMVKLAADFESFSNVPVEQVLAAFRSGMVGESEPMRQFGVLLNEDAVKAEALRLKLRTLNGTLSEQAKVMARVSLIKGSPATLKMVGDLERTAGSGKNQLRKFLGDLENFKTDLGAAFIEPMTEAIKLARELGRSLSGVFSKDSAGGFGEEMKSWISAVRLVNKDGFFVKPPDRRRDADAQAGVVSARGKGEKGDLARKKDHDAHLAALRARGIDPAKVYAATGGAAKAPTPMGSFQAGLAKHARDMAERQAFEDEKKADVRKFDLSQAGGAAVSLAKSFGESALKTIAGAGAAASGDRAARVMGQGGMQGMAGAMGPAGLLSRGGLNAVGRASEAVQAGPSKAPSQTFDSGSSFARHAAELAAGSGGMTEKQLKAQEKANELLGSVVEGVQKIAKGAGQAAGAVLRGRS